jgi:threonine/homoserine/homoserine lactone efflux protein
LPSIELLIAFFVTTAIFAFVPGPAMLYVAARTMAGGFRSGMMSVLGIHLGGYAHIAAAAAGLSALFHVVPTLYLVVKLGGAAYLIWLGVSLFRSRQTSENEVAKISPKYARRAFLQSITVEVLNPKTALFFLAFLPQFVDAAGTVPIWLQFAILGMIVNLTFTLSDLTCVLLAGFVVSRISRASVTRRLVQKAGGVVLVGLGAHLALQRS